LKALTKKLNRYFLKNAAAKKAKKSTTDVKKMARKFLFKQKELSDGLAKKYGERLK
jgi:hypothetical protein